MGLAMELETSQPESHGLSSSDVLRLLERIEDLELQVNRLMLLQDGKVTARFDREPYRKEAPTLLFSLSKSFTSIAAGIARDEGYIRLTDPVVSYFPDKLPGNVPPYLSQMTIHHLLSMNTGHHDNIYGRIMDAGPDWAQTFLSLEPEYPPGSHYMYNTHATYMVAAILERATGMSLVEYLKPRLFEPLGVGLVDWETCPMGVTAGGMGLSMPIDGVAKFGQMLLNEGVYAGRRIVSADYIRLATSEQSDNRRSETRADFSEGYGYQFFRCRQGCYMGNGGFGQICFVAPKHGIVIAAASGMSHMKKQLPQLLDLIHEYIVNRVDRSQQISSEAYPLLLRRIARMQEDAAYSVPSAPAALPDAWAGRYHVRDSEPGGMAEITVCRLDERYELRLRYADGSRRELLFDLTKRVSTEDVFRKDLAMHRQEAVISARLTGDLQLELTVVYIETPYRVTLTLTFADGDVELVEEINVSFDKRTTRVTAIKQEELPDMLSY
ncbi:CubicO group peptidase (beta-lactamase class C family) [Paenibacillus rhizosphaerae]|uniref:CubicO group peptidase (Beta-lactamase class C family) n=1 Tax=Paenibacillus rhizosphaerae TaxID=297318 RepID=A0A839TRR0_9BACL|nr:serine hydrolase [Paenibacillus rhizosphaerae]MBB3129412.1 CubicO group peptidase (beta-lactamase class C family) [Paenibacillus rhizosphaerae]